MAVLLPVYNGGHLLRDSVESVLRQTELGFEFVICDDCSTDDSWLYLQSLRDPRIRLLRNETNRGLFATLNSLLEASKTWLIHLWSQDDQMMPDCLAEVLAFHLQHPAVGMTWSQFDLVDAKGDLLDAHWNASTRPEWILGPESYAELSLIWGCLPYNIANVAIKRAIAVAAGRFREDMVYAGDFEYWSRLSQLAPVARIPKKLIRLRSHKGQTSAQLPARVANVHETLDVSRRLLSRVRVDFRREMQLCFDWKVVPGWAMTWWLCVFARRWTLAGACWRALGRFGNPLHMILKAVLMHVLRILNADSWVYRRLFLDAHYTHLASVGIPDEGIATVVARDYLKN